MVAKPNSQSARGLRHSFGLDSTPACRTIEAGGSQIALFLARRPLGAPRCFSGRMYFGPVRRMFQAGLEARPDNREQLNHPRGPALRMFRLWASARPGGHRQMHISPAYREGIGWDAEASKPGQAHQTRCHATLGQFSIARPASRTATLISENAPPVFMRHAATLGQVYSGAAEQETHPRRLVWPPARAPRCAPCPNPPCIASLKLCGAPDHPRRDQPLGQRTGQENSGRPRPGAAAEALQGTSGTHGV